MAVCGQVRTSDLGLEISALRSLTGSATVETQLASSELATAGALLENPMAYDESLAESETGATPTPPPSAHRIQSLPRLSM